MESIRNKIQLPEEPLILYEIIPPSIAQGEKAIEEYAKCTAELAENCQPHINAFNIPEIHAEEGSGERTYDLLAKLDPRDFANYLQKHLGNQHDMVINHSCVHQNKDEQLKWLDESLNHYNINNIVLVGGESSKRNYPGPSVIEMLNLISQSHSNQFLCGGITLPVRRSPQHTLDEPERMLYKAKAGIGFFTSQVLYDGTAMKHLLRDYYALCCKTNTKPKRIFLSFAPIACKKDIEFMQWLGVLIPATTINRIACTTIGIGWRSNQVVAETLQDILHFMEDNNIQVPIGINIEHITPRNFDMTKDMLDLLGPIYYAYIDRIRA